MLLNTQFSSSALGRGFFIEPFLIFAGCRFLIFLIGKKKDRIEHFWKLLRLNLIFWFDSFHFLLRSPVQLMEIILWVSGWFQNQKGHRDTSCAVSRLETGYGGCVQRLSLSQPYAPECIINKVTRSVYLRLNSWERQSWLSVWGRAVLGIKKLFHLSWC